MLLQQGHLYECRVISELAARQLMKRDEAADTDHFNESSTPLLFTNAVLHLTKCAKLFNTVNLFLMKHHLRISLVLMTLRPGGGTSNAPSHSSDRFLSSCCRR